MAETDRTLYYFPGSYYSLRAVLALYEKQLPFNDHLLNILIGEQLTDSFLKVNPKGLVPVLKDGDKFIAESDDIIDYLDKTYKTGPPLVPDESTQLGKEVRQVRELINTIRIEIVSYGILLNRQFSVKGPQIPAPIGFVLNKKAVDYKFSNALRILDAKIAKEADPVLKGILEKKKAHDIDFRDTINDPDKVARVLDELEHVFYELGTLLETRRKEAAGNTEYWLGGATFTAADISAANLFFRLYQAGVDERYYSATIRPLVHAYNVRLLKRASVIQMRAQANTAFKILLRGKMKQVAVKSVKIVLVTGLLGLGAYGIWKYCHKNS